MLSDQSRAVIAATLPAVAEHIEEIARRFYGHMFAAHPELLDGIFNRGNQAEGTQQVALASSVTSFASALIQNPNQLPEQLLMRISPKHTSLGIRPDQYQIVHDNLFWAIADVLGETVTSEVGAAWDEVYWLLADLLISQERGLYSARGVRADTVWRGWRVEETIEDTENVVRFTFCRIDDRLVKTSLPGQYVSLKIPMPDGTHQPRQYSLIHADDGEHRSIAVKRVHGGNQPDGEVSNLWNSVDVGDIVTMSLPFGNVVLDDSGRPLVFVSAGIGITPMAGMLSHLVAAGSQLPITLWHADLNEANFALKKQVFADLTALPNASAYVWYESGGESTLPVAGVYPGLMNLDDVELPDAALFYLCGPLPFMAAIRSALLARGVPARDSQYEVFGPDLSQADAETEPVHG